MTSFVPATCGGTSLVLGPLAPDMAGLELVYRFLIPSTWLLTGEAVVDEVLKQGVSMIRVKAAVSYGNTPLLQRQFLVTHSPVDTTSPLASLPAMVAPSDYPTSDADPAHRSSLLLSGEVLFFGANAQRTYGPGSVTGVGPVTTQTITSFSYSTLDLEICFFARNLTLDFASIELFKSAPVSSD